MPRPVVVSEQAESRDRAAVGVMLERVRASTWRPPAVNKQLIFHLKEALKIMTDYDRRDDASAMRKDERRKTRSDALEVAADEAVRKANGARKRARKAA